MLKLKNVSGSLVVYYRGKIAFSINRDGQAKVGVYVPRGILIRESVVTWKGYDCKITPRGTLMIGAFAIFSLPESYAHRNIGIKELKLEGVLCLS